MWSRGTRGNRCPWKFWSPKGVVQVPLAPQAPLVALVPLVPLVLLVPLCLWRPWCS